MNFIYNTRSRRAGAHQSIANQNYLDSTMLLAYKTALIQLHSKQIHGKTQRFLTYVTEACILVAKAELVGGHDTIVI